MILFNDFKRQWADVGGELTAALTAVGESGWYILGSEVQQFEAALANAWTFSHAIGVASGLDALEISLRILNCKPGDKVLTTPVSAFATTLAIVKLGAVPVFVDCDEHGLIDLDACRGALTADPSIRFLVPVHLYGHGLDLEVLSRLRDEFSLNIVEDCAQSILATSRGRMAGTVGQVAATSFYPTKNLGAIGDGGAILTNDSAAADRARALRDYGQSRKYHHDTVGYNSRLDELQAAFLRRVFLPKLHAWSTRRCQIATRYLTSLKNPRLHVPGPPQHSSSVWHLFPIFVDPSRKQDFIQHLRAARISVAEHYPLSIMDQPVMADVPHEVIGNCAQARRICSSEVSLPIHPYLTDDEVDRIVAACNGWEG